MMTIEMPINLNQAVFTTDRVIRQHLPVVLVIHDAEGDWHFFDGEADLTSENVMLVSWQQMLEHDATLSDLLGLPAGMEAIRQDISSSWQKRLAQ